MSASTQEDSSLGSVLDVLWHGRVALRPGSLVSFTEEAPAKEIDVVVLQFP